ncbi:cytochrome P450 [Niveomyces insectorum RCEF 264]|uniref:Cytochrome P450 n=1 Tax=Niveomyces insectorum RCEF 264 TaxID=1081102 RepID=A0A162MT77_9HYPO|nr:cytochrome P450 [Niveomyces insectorum RCEF 264]
MALSLFAWAVVLGTTAVLYYVAAAVVAARRLRAFHGPKLASFSYLWMARTALSGRMGEIYYRDATLRYGPVARIGPIDLITSDPVLIRRLSATRTPQYRRSSWYEPNRLDPYEHSMFSLRDDAAHDRLKMRTAAAYAGRENPALEAEVDAVLAQLVRVLRTRYARRRLPCDLATLAQYFTLDSITKVAFGQSFGFLEREEDIHSYMQGILDVAPVMQMCGEIPALAAVVASPLMLKLAGPKLTDKKGIGRLMAVARDLVSERFGPDAKDRRDMLGAFVRNGLTQRECETEALFQIIAGSDTTATAIRMTLLYTMTTPRVYRRLQAEVDAAFGALPLVPEDGDDYRIVPNADAEKLSYLQAVIFEGLRIHPPFVGLPFKEVPPQGDTLPDGRFVPGGTRIAPSLWALTRRADIFGADVDVFRPERWLLDDDNDGNDGDGDDDGHGDKTDRAAKIVEMRRTVDLIFGYGRWACAGKTLAFLELHKALPELLRHFDFQLVYPLRPLTQVNHNLFLQKNMWVQVSERRRAQRTDGGKP